MHAAFRIAPPTIVARASYRRTDESPMGLDGDGGADDERRPSISAQVFGETTKVAITWQSHGGN